LLFSFGNKRFRRLAAELFDERFGSALGLIETMLPLLVRQLGVGKFFDILCGTTVRSCNKQRYQQCRTPSRHEGT